MQQKVDIYKGSVFESKESNELKELKKVTFDVINKVIV
jgi:hypothetical protein